MYTIDDNNNKIQVGAHDGAHEIKEKVIDILEEISPDKPILNDPDGNPYTLKASCDIDDVKKVFEDEGFNEVFENICHANIDANELVNTIVDYFTEKNEEGELHFKEEWNHYWDPANVIQEIAPSSYFTTGSGTFIDTFIPDNGFVSAALTVIENLPNSDSLMSNLIHIEPTHTDQITAVIEAWKEGEVLHTKEDVVAYIDTHPDIPMVEYEALSQGAFTEWVSGANVVDSEGNSIQGYEKDIILATICRDVLSQDVVLPTKPDNFDDIKQTIEEKIDMIIAESSNNDDYFDGDSSLHDRILALDAMVDTHPLTLNVELEEIKTYDIDAIDNYIDKYNLMIDIRELSFEKIELGNLTNDEPGAREIVDEIKEMITDEDGYIDSDKVEEFNEEYGADWVNDRIGFYEEMKVDIDEMDICTEENVDEMNDELKDSLGVSDADDKQDNNENATKDDEKVTKDNDNTTQNEDENTTKDDDKENSVDDDGYNEVDDDEE